MIEPYQVKRVNETDCDQYLQAMIYPLENGEHRLCISMRCLSAEHAEGSAASMLNAMVSVLEAARVANQN